MPIIFGILNGPKVTSFNHFLTELRSKAEPCNFGEMADRLIRDKIVFTVTDKLRQVLLRENPLPLTRAIQLCRSFDTSQAQAKQMQDPNENTVHKVSIYGKPPQEQ